MKPYILPLADPQADLETVGGKGMSLAKLSNAGLPVPGGFHITTEAYRKFVAVNDLQDRIKRALYHVVHNQPASLEIASLEIDEHFAESLIPEDLIEEIKKAYQAYPGPNVAVAVRSSATAEDLPEASFAGQQETYLNIRGEEMLLEAVKKCWASLWTPRAIGYRIKNEIDQHSVALAVVVQEMVDAEAAGILFTANPINGRRDEMVINAAWGLGEAIVGGAVTPDTLTVSKPDGSLVRRDTAEKLVMTVRTETGTEEHPVPDHLQNEPALSDKEATELAGYGAEIERLYGTPMDIEWTLAAGKFAIVQARPVTALPEAPLDWPLPDPKGVYMRASIADLMPKPLSPLFLTLGIPTLRNQMTPLGARIVGGTPILGDQYFTDINTYAYMNSAFPAKGWFWLLFRLIPSYPRLLRKIVPIWRNELHPEYQGFVASKQDLNPAQMTARELWQETQELFRAAAFYMDGLMFATMGASAGSEMLTTNAYNRFARQEGDPDASVLLMGWDNIPVRAEKSLYDIATWAQEDENLAEYILTTPSQEIVEQFDRLDPEPVAGFSGFASRLGKHLETFGHIVFQLDFSEDLPRDHPEMMLETIKMYLRGEGKNPHKRQQASEHKRIQTAQTMLGRLKGFKRWAFTKALKAGQSMAEVREDALAEIGLAYPKIRELLGELGRRFVDAKAIEQAGDIFWLEKDEIEASTAKLEDNGALEDLSARVVERKAFHKKVSQATPPPMIPVKKRVMGFKVDMMISESEETQVGNLLKGVAASAGVVTAPARILHGPEDFDQMRPGDVLVAGTTTPAWTPLFAMASGVVTDIGGPLSHGSIVAREYGIPAVMGTGVATRRIESGQVITVDGTKGEVILDSDGEGHATPAIEWPKLEKGVTLARGSLAEHTPTPVSPLFATLGLKLANRETRRLWEEIVGADDTREMLGNSGDFYTTVNNYVYGGFKMGLKQTWNIMKVMLTQLPLMFKDTLDRWHTARQKLSDTVAEWERKDIQALSPSELLAGVRAVFGEACAYYTVIQATLPAASTSEIVFSRVYKLVKRKSDPEFTTLLFGFETMPVRAEKSLFDIATWLKENPLLAEYAIHTETEALVTDLKRETPPGRIPADLWSEYRARFEAHFDAFGRTAYEFDFANPTPAEAPSPQFEAIKLFLEGTAVSPYDRQQEAVVKREQATDSILKRVGWPRKGWFEKSLKWAQKTGAIREDSIADMGMGHPVIRRILAELGQRFAKMGAIETAEDIYWLEEDEVETLVKALENGLTTPLFADRIPERKAKWLAALEIIPPVMLPDKSFWQRFIGGGAPKEVDGMMLLEGLGTSTGQVTAPACVLFSPEDFHKMKPGDVLVATTTTPAWTPLFAMASAVVTDIGGPLSHSSIVAREYGIPAVMAARNATRYIKSGQMVTVDGKAGTVRLENHRMT